MTVLFTPERIREFRQRAGISPTELGFRLGVTENTIHRWEMGDRHPSYTMMLKLNEFFGTDKKDRAAARKLAAR